MRLLRAAGATAGSSARGRGWAVHGIAGARRPGVRSARPAHAPLTGSWPTQPLGDRSVTLVERRHVDLGRVASAICRCA
ncbi:putative leader peptide [Streptomyces sp. NPDC057486]|uniref:putative leader peptide n=1 Tax=Streptomyces sp. NPDC057486 TaxID=3346145 RepID=UPI00369DEA43